MGSFGSPSGDIEVRLDGTLVVLPPERRSLTAIRSYLESLALHQQRILCWISVDGEPVNLTHQAMAGLNDFSQVDGETIGLNEVPVQLIRAALQQTSAIRARVESAIELVLINERETAAELWWTLATSLKEPLLTLSLLPDTICGPDNGRASLLQLRKWQLQQLGSVIMDVDEICKAGDSTDLSDALERRVLPWLDKLHESLDMWHEAISHPRTPAVCPEK
jgi:hypothetical protein